MSSSIQTISTRRHTHHGQRVRTHLHRKMMSATVVAIAFLLALLITLALSVWITSPNSVMELCIIVSVSLFCLGLGVALALKARSKPHRVRYVFSFVVMGILSGVLAASVGVAYRSQPDPSKQRTAPVAAGISVDFSRVNSGEWTQEAAPKPLPKGDDLNEETSESALLDKDSAPATKSTVANDEKNSKNYGKATFKEQVKEGQEGSDKPLGGSAVNSSTNNERPSIKIPSDRKFVNKDERTFDEAAATNHNSRVDQPLSDTTATSIQPSVPILQAKPRILPSGTRLQWEPLALKQIQVRLEGPDESYLTGLHKNDFQLLTEAGKQLAFEIVESTGADIAVQSSVCIVIDESLPLESLRYKVPQVIEAILTNTTSGSYKLVSAGSSLRTLCSWTNSPPLIREAVRKTRQSYGNAFSAAVSLNFSELKQKAGEQIFVLLTSSIDKLPRHSFVQGDSKVTFLAVIPEGDIRLRKQVSPPYVVFTNTKSLAISLRSLTTQRQLPAYVIRQVDGHPGTQIRLTIGSGDSSVTAMIPTDKVAESVTAGPSR